MCTNIFNVIGINETVNDSEIAVMICLGVIEVKTGEVWRCILKMVLILKDMLICVTKVLNVFELN